MSYRAGRERAGWVPQNHERCGTMFDGIRRRRGALDGGRWGCGKDACWDEVLGMSK